MFDTCNCEKSEDCLCAALSSYVHACASKGVLLRGWRDGVCGECPHPPAEHVLLGPCPRVGLGGLECPAWDPDAGAGGGGGG